MEEWGYVRELIESPGNRGNEHDPRCPVWTLVMISFPRNIINSFVHDALNAALCECDPPILVVWLPILFCFGYLNRENTPFPIYRRSHLKRCSRAWGSAIPFEFSPLILHTQGESGPHLRDSIPILHFSLRLLLSERGHLPPCHLMHNDGMEFSRPQPSTPQRSGKILSWK